MKLAGAYINDKTYEALVGLATANNRTLAGQCRHLFDRALRGDTAVSSIAVMSEGQKVLTFEKWWNQMEKGLAHGLTMDEVRSVAEMAWLAAQKRNGDGDHGG